MKDDLFLKMKGVKPLEKDENTSIEINLFP